MAKISLKILLIASISSFVFFFNSDSTNGCAYDYEEPINGLFNSDVIVEPTLSPFFYLPTPNYYGYPLADSSLHSENDNLNEWGDYFEKNKNKKDLTFLIYKSSIEDIQSIISSISNGQTFANEKLLSNSIIKSLRSNKSIDALNYLLYAKRCEPNAVGFKTNTWDELIRDTTEMKSLIAEGLNAYSHCDDIFLKARYAYQIIRLTHYLKHYEETILLYDSLFVPLNSKSIISNWALSHKAGALWSIGEYAQSAYLFSRIFDECLSKRLLANQNFKINDASLLSETLTFCQNNHEKAVVWFLYSYKNNDLGGLKRIYDLEPKSANLEILLTRAIEKLEEDIYIYVKGYEPNWSNNFTRIDHKQFLEFVEMAAANKNTKRPYFWEYCAGYLSLLMHDYKSMETHFSTSRLLLPSGSEDLLERMKIIEIYSKSDQVTDLNLVFESKIIADLKWLLGLKKRHADEAFKWSMLKLADKYLAQKDTAKYLLCLGQKLSDASYNNTVTQIDYKSNPATIPINELLAFLQNARYFSRSSEYYKVPKFDEFLIENFFYSHKEIEELRGTVYLSMYDFYYALSYLSSIKDSLELLPADPFQMNLKDCHDCDAKALTTKLYTKYSFAKKMLELEKEIKSNPKSRAQNYFLLANAYYNITYFGNSWMITDYYRSYISEYYYPNYLDCSKSEEYYLKAITTSNDKDFQARCLFMASKCEQNRYYIDKGFFQGTIDYYPYDCERNPHIKKENYRMYFKNLNDNYSKTDFFKQALKECKYFNYFVTHN